MAARFVHSKPFNPMGMGMFFALLATALLAILLVALMAIGK